VEFEVQHDVASMAYFTIDETKSKVAIEMNTARKESSIFKAVLMGSPVSDASQVKIEVNKRKKFKCIDGWTALIVDCTVKAEYMKRLFLYAFNLTMSCRTSVPGEKILQNAGTVGNMMLARQLRMCSPISCFVLNTGNVASCRHLGVQRIGGHLSLFDRSFDP